MNIAARLLQQLEASGVAVRDVSIGSRRDKSTWTVRPESAQEAAQAVIDAYVEPTPKQLAQEDASRVVDDKVLQAVLLELHPYLGEDKPSLKELRDNIIKRYESA